jgi:hypothetical protein
LQILLENAIGMTEKESFRLRTLLFSNSEMNRNFENAGEKFGTRVWKHTTSLSNLNNILYNGAILSFVRE